MKQQKIRVVVDTNWWVSFVIKKYNGHLLRVLLDPRIEIFVSDRLEAEVRETLQDARLAKYLDAGFVADFLAVFPEAVLKTAVRSVVFACRDPKDNFLLALSKDAQAEYLITGDKDLLVLRMFGGTRIVTLPEFLAKEGEAAA